LKKSAVSEKRRNEMRKTQEKKKKKRLQSGKSEKGNKIYEKRTQPYVHGVVWGVWVMARELPTVAGIRKKGGR